MDMGDGITGRRARRRWAMLCLGFLCILAFAVMMQYVPPVLSLVMAEFQLSYAQGGLLMSLFALPGIMLSIPIGMLADRYSQKLIVVVLFVIMIAGAAMFASGNSFPILGLGRVVSGIGARGFSVIVPLFLAQWFARREMGIAMGVFHAGMPLGIILSLNILSLLGENLGWQASAWSSVGFSLVVLLIFVFLFSAAPRTNQHISPRSFGFLQDMRQAGAQIWLVGAAWMLFGATFISLITFTPDFLQASGFSIASAGFLTSLVMWPQLVLGPIVGYVLDKMGRKRTIIAVGGLTSAILVLLIPIASQWILVLMLLIGVAMSLIPVPIFALPSEITSPEKLGVAFGVLATCNNLGIVIGPATAGFIRDVTGSYQASYALMAGFALMIMFMMIILNLRHNPELPMIH
ncbi:CynX/NimT family MFS transporter [Chloroflexota bacterium]